MKVLEKKWASFLLSSCHLVHETVKEKSFTKGIINIAKYCRDLEWDVGGKGALDIETRMSLVTLEIIGEVNSGGRGQRVVAWWMIESWNIVFERERREISWYVSGMNNSTAGFCFLVYFCWLQKFHPIVFFLCEVPADNVCYMLASLGNAKRVAIAVIGNGREREYLGNIEVLRKY